MLITHGGQGAPPDHVGRELAEVLLRLREHVEYVPTAIVRRPFRPDVGGRASHDRVRLCVHIGGDALRRHRELQRVGWLDAVDDDDLWEGHRHYVRGRRTQHSLDLLHHTVLVPALQHAPQCQVRASNGTAGAAQPLGCRLAAHLLAIIGRHSARDSGDAEVPVVVRLGYALIPNRVQSRVSWRKQHPGALGQHVPHARGAARMQLLHHATHKLVHMVPCAKRRPLANLARHVRVAPHPVRCGEPVPKRPLDALGVVGAARSCRVRAS